MPRERRGRCSGATPPPPSGLAGFEHVPLAGSQRPTWWHSSATHTTRPAPTQAPAWHASVRVHASWSSQGASLGFSGLVHAPVVGSQAPVSPAYFQARRVLGLD